MYKMDLEKAEEPYKKGLNGQDNYDDVVTHLEPDILECEVLGRIIMNKVKSQPIYKVLH